jgi:hypothetical protein
MKKVILHKLQQNIVAIFSISAFIIMGSMHNPAPAAKPAENNSCGTGYSIPLNNVRKFMIDSLGTKQYEGGIFKKSDLIMLLNSMKSDTVYIMNGMFGCDFSKGTGLAITSPQNANVGFLGWYSVGYCYPCPLRACCPKKFCVINTHRDCATYLPYPSGVSSGKGNIENAEE